jgi:1-phosphofructokinase family hexose kinase
MLIAGPNLTIDRTLSLDELVPGEVLRCTDAAITPGGKGVNVARVARDLRAPALLVSFVPGRTGQAVAGLIADEGLALAGVPIGGEIRSAAILLERGGRVTVLNEPGPQITDLDWARYEEQVERHLADHAVLVCSGSVPPGAPESAYGTLVRLAHARSVPAVVDATGPALRWSLEAGPDLVSPNVTEAETALGGRDAPSSDGESDIAERALGAARALVERGARTAIVTAGELGLAVAGEETPRWIEAPEVAVRNPVGAGDSFVGGLAAWLERGERIDQAVAAGMAAAASSVESMLAGGIDVARMEELARRLQA